MSNSDNNDNNNNKNNNNDIKDDQLDDIKKKHIAKRKNFISRTKY